MSLLDNVNARIAELKVLAKIKSSLTDDEVERLTAEWDGYSKRTALIEGTQSYEFLQMVKRRDPFLYNQFIIELRDIFETDDE